MISLSLNFPFYMLFRLITWAPHGPFWWRHLVGQPRDPVWIPPPYGGTPSYTPPWIC